MILKFAIRNLLKRPFLNLVKITGKDFRLLSGIESIDIPAGRIIGVVKIFIFRELRRRLNRLYSSSATACGC